MTIDAFRIEAVALDLARSSRIADLIEPPISDDDRVAQLLLAVVSSRVRWETACAIASDAIALVTQDKADESSLSEATLRIAARHRHPIRTARWLAVLVADRGRLAHEALEITTSSAPKALIRRRLVRTVPGLGPKQASMLLRNLGCGQDVAVLDRHVLRFMHLLGLSDTVLTPSIFSSYERAERIFLTYASFRRVQADALDMAAWLVMRSLAGLSYHEQNRHPGIRRSGLDSCRSIGS